MVDFWTCSQINPGLCTDPREVALTIQPSPLKKSQLNQCNIYLLEKSIHIKRKTMCMLVPYSQLQITSDTPQKLINMALCPLAHPHSTDRLALSSNVRSNHCTDAVCSGSMTRAIRWRARLQHRSERIGFRLYGIALEPAHVQGQEAKTERLQKIGRAQACYQVNYKHTPTSLSALLVFTHQSGVFQRVLPSPWGSPGVVYRCKSGEWQGYKHHPILLVWRNLGAGMRMMKEAAL